MLPRVLPPLAFVSLAFAFAACEPADTVAPHTEAKPAGGLFAGPQTVKLLCDDSRGSGCDATWFTTDGSEPTTASTRYEGTLTVDATTTLRFFSTDAAGNREQVRTETYTIDTTPPTTTATPDGGAFGAPVSVMLTCDDGAGTGCAATHYTTDGSTPTTDSPTAAGPIALAASTTLRYFSLDVGGNTEASREAAFVIDQAAPSTSAVPPGGIFRTAPTVTLQCDDASGSGCAATFHTLDGTAPTTASPRATGPVALPASATLRFFSTDGAGNAEEVRTEEYLVDAAPPATSAQPPGGTFRTPPRVALTCADGEAGSGCSELRYTLDGADPVTQGLAYTGPIDVLASATLRFYALDHAGNAGLEHAETYLVDGTAPVTSADPSGGPTASPRTVTLSCNDGAGSGCTATHYTTDGSVPTTASARYEAPLSIATNTMLRFFSLDAAGNAEAPRTETYVFDAVAPTTTANPAEGAFAAPRTVALHCDDAGAGCDATFVTLDGSEPTTASPRYATPILIGTTTTVRFRSTDRAGNLEAARSARYVIDGTAPTTAVSLPGGSYEGLQLVSLTCADTGDAGCRATYYTVDGSTPTTSSATYTSAIRLTVDTTLRFFSVDTAGNAEAARTESYDITDVSPTTVASPRGGISTFARTVSLACTPNARNATCAATHYTLDGSPPTTSSPRYTTPLSISATTTLRFFSVDSRGNEELPRSERYVIDTLPPGTAVTPAGGTFTERPLVTLACTDAGDAGCAATYFTLDGSTPTTASTRYTGPFRIATRSALRFFSTDLAGNNGAPVTQTYLLDVPDATSAQLAAVRAAADGPIALPVDFATVSYVKPAVGLDSAGFFLQAEKSGPALFVAVTPSMLSPAPVVGARASFVATEKRTQDGQVRLVGLSGWTLSGTAASVEHLRFDASAVDLPAELGAYESRLLAVAGTTMAAPTSAGTGHVQMPLATIGAPSGALRLRLPTVLADTLELATGCAVDVRAPLWRFNTTAQVHAWTTDDFAQTNCPAPRLVSAYASTSTTVVLQFDRRIDALSVTDASLFTFTGGLVATVATVSEREITLTTSVQSTGQAYEVTVPSGVRDTTGTPVDPAARVASFRGHVPAARLLLTETNPNLPNGSDLVELFVWSGGSVQDFTLVQMDSAGPTVLATLPDVFVQTGDVIVVHMTPSGVNGDPSGSETTGKAQYPQAAFSANYDTAWDFHGRSTGMSYSNRVLRIRDATGETQDAVPFVVPTASPPLFFPVTLQALQSEGRWQPTDCAGTPCTYTSTPSAFDVSVNWQSLPNTRGSSARRLVQDDFDTGSEWSSGGMSNFGVFP